MKNFKCGLSIFFSSVLILGYIVAAGVAFYCTAIESGYLSVFLFFGGLFSLFIGGIGIYCMGATYQTEKRGVDNA